MYLVFHDNGIPGQYGVTEYSDLEVADEGGIEELLHGYAQSNVTVYGWENGEKFEVSKDE